MSYQNFSIPNYSLQPVSSPSEHSLFSVHSISSSSSSISDRTGNSLNLGRKLKKALSRSGSVSHSNASVSSNDSTSNLQISNPVPLTEIPCRKGSIDLNVDRIHKNGSYSNIEESLRNNTNYYFHHDRSHSVPQEPVGMGRHAQTIAEEDEDSGANDDDFYFTQQARPAQLSPFDVIFQHSAANSISSIDSTHLQLSSAVAGASGAANAGNKRVSTASTITPAKVQQNYRSSRITLNRIAVQPSETSTPLSPEFSLFSPTKDQFANVQSLLAMPAHEKQLVNEDLELFEANTEAMKYLDRAMEGSIISSNRHQVWI